MSGTPVSLAFAGVLLLLCPAFCETPPAPGAAPERAGRAVPLPDTLVGEVVDIQCFARSEKDAGAGREGGAAVSGGEAGASASGEPGGWNECGVSAVKRGAPVGIRLRDGVILLAAMRDRNPAGRALARFIGMEVRLAGYRLSEGGIDLLEITRILGRDELRASREEEP
jgi:hypothetical protein